MMFYINLFQFSSFFLLKFKKSSLILKLLKMMRKTVLRSKRMIFCINYQENFSPLSCYYSKLSFNSDVCKVIVRREV